MSYYTPDVYYQPEKFDLTPVAEIDYSDGNYQFDYRVVWKHEPTDRLLTARDSGCSCPSPFEDYTKLEDLDELNFDDLKEEVQKELDHDWDAYPSELDAASFLRKVHDAQPAPGQASMPG
jgi:hypothetical protein